MAPLRGLRLSALCLLSIQGFEDWRFTEHTYTTALFNYATLGDDKDWGMLSLPRARHGGLSLIERFPLLLIDNARIHTSDEFEQAVRAKGGIVKFLPPYCWNLSPLDNGAFGLVVRYLEVNAARLSRVPLSDALAEAFLSVTPDAARYCYRNCGYQMDW